MRVHGLNYDTGLTVGGHSTRPSFVDGEVRHDIRAIANGLHATAIRVSGEDVERLEFAGRCALEAGLEVWLSPTSCDLEPDDYVDHVVRAAATAERLRCRGKVVAVLGAEMSLFGKRGRCRLGVLVRLRRLRAPPPERRSTGRRYGILRRGDRIRPRPGRQSDVGAEGGLPRDRRGLRPPVNGQQRAPLTCVIRRVG